MSNIKLIQIETIEGLLQDYLHVGVICECGMHVEGKVGWDEGEAESFDGPAVAPHPYVFDLKRDCEECRLTEKDLEDCIIIFAANADASDLDDKET